jgi:hypothetical protein
LTKLKTGVCWLAVTLGSPSLTVAHLVHLVLLELPLLSCVGVLGRCVPPAVATAHAHLLLLVLRLGLASIAFLSALRNRMAIKTLGLSLSSQLPEHLHTGGASRS